LQQWHHESDFWICAVVNLWFLTIWPGSGVHDSIKHWVPHCLTMKILDKNLWARQGVQKTTLLNVQGSLRVAIGFQDN
jgi:hypothetical protein